VVLVEVPETSAAAAEGFRAVAVREGWFAAAAGAGVPVAAARWLMDSAAAGAARPLAAYAL
jgi:hypothetical protein